MTDIADRIDRIERILLIVTRDVVDQQSSVAATELRRLVDDIRGEHPAVRRSHGDLILDTLPSP